MFSHLFWYNPEIYSKAPLKSLIYTDVSGMLKFSQLCCSSFAVGNESADSNSFLPVILV